MTQNIYLISGLGADERIFQKLDFGKWNPIFIKWISPFANESIEHYAKRLTAQIKTEKPIILGVSFGGIMAIEIAKLIDYQKIILISSAKTKDEIPFLYRFLGKLKLHKIVPAFILKHANPISYYFFGMKTKEEKTLLKNILHDTDGIFLKWAMDKIVNWKNEHKITNLTHIHGNSDKILPIEHCEDVNFCIPNGGHLMVYQDFFALNRIFFSI